MYIFQKEIEVDLQNKKRGRSTKIKNKIKVDLPEN
jgi:hypothetical protein